MGYSIMKKSFFFKASGLVIWSLLVPIAAFGQGWNITQVGILALYWDTCNKVNVAGNYAYAATGNTGLRILDISDPTAPVETGYCFTPGSAQDVDIAGDYAYVADAGEGLRIIDVSSPETPFEVGFCSTTNTANAVTITGEYAYVAAGSYGLRIIDITDPQNPFEAGFCDTPDNALDVDVSGNYAYVADDEAGLRIIDVTDPLNPEEEGFFDNPAYTYGVVVRDSIAYLAAEHDGLWVVNISDPSAPAAMGQCNVSPGTTWDVAVQGDYAYTATGWYGMHIVDISNPYSPSVVGNYYPSSPHGIAIADDYAYLAISGYAELHVIDISNPSVPSQVGEYGWDDFFLDVAVSDTLAYVAYSMGGLQILDIADPASPRIISSCPIGWWYSLGLEVAGNYAYVTYCGYDEGGLQAIDISDPLSPQPLDYYMTYDDGSGVQVVGNYAYLTAYGDGLSIIDISDPNSLAGVGYYNTPGWAIDVAVSGDYAYVADYWGLRILNVADPANPFEVGSYAAGGGTGVAVQGDYAYVVDGSLQILDISNPSAPALVGSCDVPVNYVTVAGEYVFATGADAGLYVIKVSNPYSPILTGHYDTPGQAMKVAVEGNLVYVADYYNFGIYDCSEAMTQPLNLTLTPVNPPITIPPGGGEFQFDIVFENTSTANITFDAWIEVVIPDTHNVYTRQRMNNTLPAGGISSFNLTQSVPGSAPAGLYVYNAYVGVYPDTLVNSDFFTFEKLTGEGVALHNPGWELYGWNDEETVENPCLSEFCLYQPYPNPFNASTAISYQLLAVRNVNLTIYDIAGREVAILVDGMKPAGAHQVVFDADGLTSGVYFARLTAGEFRQTRKILLVK